MNHCKELSLRTESVSPTEVNGFATFLLEQGIYLLTKQIFVLY